MDYLNKLKYLIIPLAFSQNIFAGLQTPHSTSWDAEGAFACGIEKSWVHCYVGDVSVPRSLEFNRPVVDKIRIDFVSIDLGQPLTVAVGEERYCVLTVERVRCFLPENTYHLGEPFLELDVPPLKHPRQISIAGYQNCALDDDGAHCWSYWRNGSGMGDKKMHPIHVPALANPKKISVERSEMFALDDNGVECWSPDGACNLSVKERHPGLIGDGGAHGNRDFHAFDSRDVVTKENPKFNLDQIHDLTHLLSRISSPAYSRFFSGMNGVIKDKLQMKLFNPSNELSSSRYLALRLLEPALRSINTSYFSNTFLPKYQESIDSIEAELNVNSVAHLPRSGLNREVALRAIQISLGILADFTSPESRERFDPLPRLIGQSIINSENLRSLFQSLDQVGPALETVEAQPKAQFLVQTIRLSEEWLKGN